jgi:hypothetical protein
LFRSYPIIETKDHIDIQGFAVSVCATHCRLLRARKDDLVILEAQKGYCQAHENVSGFRDWSSI